MLKLALPTGSLQQPTLEMFAAADLAITTPNSRCYEASIEDPGFPVSAGCARRRSRFMSRMAFLIWE